MKETSGYLSVGKDTLNPNSFIPVSNTTRLKPQGGLWATKHIMEMKGYNEWMDYITENPNILFYKYKSFDIPAIFFTLKQDAKIYTIDSKDAYNDLKISFPDFDNGIDYNLVASAYDGVYFDVSRLATDKEMSTLVNELSVNSLLLFNLDCIDTYRQAMVYIDLDDCNGFECYEYSIHIDKKLLTINDELKLTKRRR